MSDIQDAHPDRPTAAALSRREIPSLDSARSTCFAPVIVARSYPFGRGSPIRICRGEAFVVWVQVHEAHASACRVRFFSTIEEQGENGPHYEECERLDGRFFMCSFVPSRSGAQVFRASYSLDNGTTWTSDDAPYSWLLVDPPFLNDIRMYTLIPSATGTISDWKRELHRIHQLGCNVVHLLPVTLMDESMCPYSAHDLFSVDHSYLDPADPRDGLAQWEDFVVQAKAEGIRLCVDLVLNHVGTKSRIARERPEWVVPDPSRPDGFKRAGCRAGPRWVSWEDLVLLNFANPDQAARDKLWSYMAEYAMFWSSYAAYTDGMVRFDNLHSSNPEFMSTLTRALRIKYPDLVLLAEFFADENTLVRRTLEWDLDLLLATPWEYKFVPELRQYLRQLHRMSEQVRFLVPVSSHDSGSLVQEFWTAEATYPRYAVSALLSSGATGMSQGVEWGLERKINFQGRNLPLSHGESERLSSFIRRINQILRAHRAFQLPQYCQFVDNNHPAIIAAVRVEPLRSHECFVVAANFDIRAQQRITIDVGPHMAGSGEFGMADLLAHETPRTVHDPRIEISLEPCGVQVLHCRRARSH